MLLLVIVIVIIILVLLLYCRPCSRKEGFPDGKRIEMPCPTVNTWEKDLLPLTVIFVVQGYNYNRQPRFYRDGLPLIPIGLNHDWANLTYYYTIQVPDGREHLLDHVWEIWTENEIRPRITEGYSQIVFEPRLVDSYKDSYTWGLVPEIKM